MHTPDQTPSSSQATDIHFSFGEPEPVTHGIFDTQGLFYDPYREYYVPPVSMRGLDTLARANAAHRRCINFKVNQVAIVFQATGLISLRDFRRAVRDLETFGNVYLKAVFNGLGQIVQLQHLPALNMRKGKHNVFKMLVPGQDTVTFKPGEVLHTYHYDTGQSIYGLPEWIASVQDVFLNSEATLFRRRYYKNGSHLGYILYTTDPNMDKDTEDAIKDAIRKGKGVGSFKSMYINIPNGKEKAVQIIPVGDIAQRDEFASVKNISADDIIVGHGVPPVLAGMKPDNVGGFGDIEKIEQFYRRREVPALVQPFLELNGFLPTGKGFLFDFEQ